MILNKIRTIYRVLTDYANLSLKDINVKSFIIFLAIVRLVDLRSVCSDARLDIIMKTQ